MSEITFEFACRDDCLDKMVPSDLRVVVAERDSLRQQVEGLELRIKQEEHRHGQTIDERDAAQYALDEVLDMVLGKDRCEWSNLYQLCDAANDVEQRLAAQPVAVEQEPVAWENRFRAKRIDGAEWSDWFKCSKEDHDAFLVDKSYVVESEVRALYAAPPAQARPVVPEWQPIETAPKDGSTIIVGRDMGNFGFVRGYARWEGAGFVSGWVSNGFTEPPGNLGLAHPTHWVPLPAAPAAQEQEKGS